MQEPADATDQPVPAAAGPGSTGIEPSPDHLEEKYAEPLDDPVAVRGYPRLPLVGLGGSAGSIPALRAFFATMPAESGMAFVVVLHLAADRSSSLAELIQACTPMPVEQVHETARVEANRVYVIPPGKVIESVEGYLRLRELDNERGRRVAVDLFFRTLADSHGPQATAIVLSGADGDGAIGIKRVKERGGLTIAQDPDEAEFSGMPRSAIATGMVDWVLPMADIAPRLQQYREIEGRLQLPPEAGPQPAQPLPPPADDRESLLREVLAFLRTATGRDFSYYKRATILRRIGRRMRVNGTEDLQAYIGFLRTHRGEATALLKDLLISVTNFFRDREAFEALEAQIPQLFEAHTPEDPVRVWVPACATGEEAYSIAMLLAEHARTLDVPPPFQIFATDLDAQAIRTAREALYPHAIDADVSEARLRRFFVKDPQGYRVRNELRETVLFAAHDLLADSPFSRLDLISCRNLLIYLDRGAQQVFFGIAHFALGPRGRLFLGPSETAEHEAAFRVVDKKHRIFENKAAVQVPLPLGLGHTTVSRAAALQRKSQELAPAPARALAVPANRRPNHWLAAMPEQPGAGSWRGLHLKLLELVAPPSVVVTAEHEIVHLSENAGRFLQFSGGEPTSDLLHAVRPALVAVLRASLLRAAAAPGPVRSAPVTVDIDGAPTTLTLHVQSAGDVAPGFLLVVFEGQPASPGEQAANADPAPVRDAQREVEELKWHLRDLSERGITANAELKSSNEELQAMNEELRSSTEELETSREELQSINEELLTVNHELKAKVEELAHANSDLNNFMASTAIAAVFLTRDMCITRFTPQAATLFNVIASDVGRPLSDLASDLDYPQMEADAATVLETLVPVEREVRTRLRSYLARVLPYRTSDDHIAGVVLTFLDITTRKQAEDALRDSEALFRTIVNQSAAGVCHADLDSRVTLVNSRYSEITGYSSDELMAADFFEVIHPDDRKRSQALHAQMLEDGKPFEIEKRIVRKDGRTAWVSNATTLLRDHAGVAQSVVTVSLDVTARRQAEEALRLSDERLRLVMENAVEYAILTMDMGRRITSWYAGAERVTQFAEREVIGEMADIIFTPEDCAAGAPAREAATAMRDGRAADERWHLRKDGSRFWGSGVMMAMRDSTGQPVGLLKIFRDSTDQRATQMALETSRSELVAALADKEKARLDMEAAGRAKDRFLATLSHELRTPLTPIVMAAHALERTADLPPGIKAMLDVIRRNIRAEMFLIDDLLDLTRISSGKLEIVHEAVDLHVAIQSALEVCEADIRARQQRIRLRLEATEHRTVGDENRLRQVVWNLIKNAAKFTPVGGEVSIVSRNVGKGIEISVSDTGVGIDSDKLVTIFDAFTQGSELISREYGGLGLGLAIAKAMIDAHHGTLRAESSGLGQGSTFTIALPLVSPT